MCMRPELSSFICNKDGGRGRDGVSVKLSTISLLTLPSSTTLIDMLKSMSLSLLVALIVIKSTMMACTV